MLDFYLNHHEYRVVFGDFNMNLAKPEVNIFLNTISKNNLFKENTCFKGASSCIELILTNPKYSF